MVPPGDGGDRPHSAPFREDRGRGIGRCHEVSVTDPTPEELAALLPSWTLEGGRLVRSFRFPDFASGLAFVVRVGALAEERHHHPDVELRWGLVKLSLWTHDAGRLTHQDVDLARAIGP
ncbi:MAG: 4a-hydroxytetrahydrobiopterin dehydratase [Myxococcales bacterium]|nr:4a-hydroxytetrahydrobiopterin dehydratase [Myxococcales bacterium]